MTEGYITRKLVGQPPNPGLSHIEFGIAQIEHRSDHMEDLAKGPQNMRWFPYGNLAQLQKIAVLNRQTINGLCSSIFRSYVKLPKGNGQPTPPKKNGGLTKPSWQKLQVLRKVHRHLVSRPEKSLRIGDFQRGTSFQIFISMKVTRILLQMARNG